MLALAMIFGFLATGMLLVIWGTMVKGQMGVNLGRVWCPRCNTELPQVRKPQTWRQAMWGGGVCPACGLETDKWGREVSGGQGAFSGGRSGRIPAPKIPLGF
jgi:hypothetical protein